MTGCAGDTVICAEPCVEKQLLPESGCIGIVRDGIRCVGSQSGKAVDRKRIEQFNVGISPPCRRPGAELPPNNDGEQEAGNDDANDAEILFIHIVSVITIVSL